jgi:hypothetical protein
MKSDAENLYKAAAPLLPSLPSPSDKGSLISRLMAGAGWGRTPQRQCCTCEVRESQGHRRTAATKLHPARYQDERRWELRMTGAQALVEFLHVLKVLEGQGLERSYIEEVAGEFDSSRCCVRLAWLTGLQRRALSTDAGAAHPNCRRMTTRR